MKKKIIITLFAFVLGVALGYLLVSHFNDTSKHNAEKKAPSWMFVVSATKGEIKRGKDGKHLLVIQKADMKKATAFTDRPYRDVKDITGKRLLKLWHEGKNSFKQDPPNAVLSGANKKPIIVILTGMESTKDSIKYHLSFTHNAATKANIVRAPRHIDNLVLTIDNYNCYSFPCFAGPMSTTGDEPTPLLNNKP